jgi:hypothetical protein
MGWICVLKEITGTLSNLGSVVQEAMAMSTKRKIIIRGWFLIFLWNQANL